MEMRQRGKLHAVVWQAASLFVLAPALGTARAHPLQPTLLELHERGDGHVEVAWKRSLLRVPGVDVQPVLPPDCQSLAAPEDAVEADSVTTRWTMQCGSAGLVGQRLGFMSLDEAKIDGLVRVTLADGRVVRGVVRAAEPFFTVPERERPLDIVRGYVVIGIQHILGGLDHLLFVTGLLLLVGDTALLVKTITAFTAGHSVTLSLAVLGFVHIPQRPIEVLIALSVFVLAVELSREASGPATLMRRRPWGMALLFGLLHGLGFAGALAEVGLPQADIPLALFSFNLGIEIGQLVFVLALLALGALLRPVRLHLPRWAEWVPVYAMGSLAAFWCFERTAALLL